MADDRDPDSNRRAAESRAQLYSILVAAASGVGALGLIVFVGGAVLLARFDAAGVPSEEALSVVPKSLLLTVGADTIAPVLAATGVIVGIYWTVNTLLSKRNERLPSKYATSLFVGLGVLTYLIEVHWQTNTRSLLTVVAGLLAAGGAWGVVQSLTDSNTIRIIVLAVAVAVAAGLISWVDARDQPLVRGVAALSITAGHDVTGLFIAETSDRVYIAQVSCQPGNINRGKDDTARLLVLPRSSIAVLAIGRNERLPKALRHGQELLAVLRMQNGRPNAQPEPPDPNCTPARQ